jgi:hypothetical protein
VSESDRVSNERVPELLVPVAVMVEVPVGYSVRLPVTLTSIDGKYAPRADPYAYAALCACAQLSRVAGLFLSARVTISGRVSGPACAGSAIGTLGVPAFATTAAGGGRHGRSGAAGAIGAPPARGMGSVHAVANTSKPTLPPALDSFRRMHAR